MEKPRDVAFDAAFGRIGVGRDVSPRLVGFVFFVLRVMANA